MSYRIQFTIHALPRLQADTLSKWVRAKERKYWHKFVAQHVMASGGRPKVPLEKAVIRCVRHSTIQPDYANLVYSFKPVVDGLVKCAVLRDDKPSVLVDEAYEWSKAKRGAGRIEVVVEEA